MPDCVTQAGNIEHPTQALIEYIIDATRIEELQTLNDTNELEKIFSNARSTIVNGEKVVLIRKTSAGTPQKFDELTTLQELQLYRERVFKYVK